MTHESGYPIVLSAEATVPSQTTQRPPQLALMNPTGEAFKIHEIRFSLKNSEAVAGAISGATVGCKLELGKIALTENFVPVWNFGRVTSYDQDLNNQFSWKLAHPLFVPAAGILTPNFQNFGQVSTSITTRISFFATPVESSAPLPNRIFLPWVSAYIGKAMAYEDADSDSSRETDLLNPFNDDLRISRLIGRFNIFNASSSTNGGNGTGSQLLSTRISLSNGDPLVRTATPFQQIFGEDGRSWEQRNTVLRSKQYFQVYIDKLATTDAAVGCSIQPYVSLVGYREMVLSSYKTMAMEQPS